MNFYKRRHAEIHAVSGAAGKDNKEWKKETLQRG
jgi:hypothetical protein